ncbi:MAG: DUF2834 domain-containing protein [Cyanobacteria bacterium J06623_4]
MDSAKTTQISLPTAANRSANYNAIYFICSVVSLVISWSIFAQFLFSGTASVDGFFAEAFATPVATLVSSDVLLSAVIFLIWARVELKRLGMPSSRMVIYAIATFSVGVCFGLSLFLYQREDWLSRR